MSTEGNNHRREIRRDSSMSLGRRLATLFVGVSVACTVLFIAIVAPALSNLVSLGKPLCLPGLSIKCYESDCGDYYLRCGSDVLHQVPADQVCFQGALLPSKQTDLHKCQPGSRNNTNEVLKSVAASCSTCPSSCPGQTFTCSCECNGGGNVKKVCGGKTYANSVTASCCGCASAQTDYNPSIREQLQDAFESRFREPIIRFFGNTISVFTFSTPILTSCICSPSSGSCTNAKVCP